MVHVHGGSHGDAERGLSRLLQIEVSQPRRRVGNKWYRVPGSTTDLNTLQMTNYLEKVKADAATEFGITLPLPEDRNYEAFVAEYRIR